MTTMRVRIEATDAEDIRRLLDSKRGEMRELISRAIEIDYEIQEQIAKARFWNGAAIVSLSVGLVATLLALVLG